MKKILITGGSGFIGSHLISTLLEIDSDLLVINVDLNPSPLINERITSYQVDIRDIESLELLKLNEVDCCIHLAALCKEPGFEWEEYFTTNSEGTKNIIKICEENCITNILFTSTMMVYQAGEFRRNEEDIKAPDTAYGISKFFAELSLREWRAKDQGRKLKILRPSVVFGFNEKGNFTRLYYALRGGSFAFVGRTSTVKSCVYVKELVSALIFLKENETNFEVYNFSFLKPYSIIEIVQTFRKVFSFKKKYLIIPYRLLIFISKIFLILDKVGLRNSIHPRRVQKLFYSTNINSSLIVEQGFKFKYDLESSLIDWKQYGNNEGLQ